MPNRDRLPGQLAGLPPEELDALLKESRVERARQGDHLSWQGHGCSRFGFVLEGQVRVYKLGQNGREVTLYHLGPGDCCILAASCLLSGHPFPAFAVAETEVELLTVSPDVLKGLVATHEFWRAYLFGMLARRLGDVIEVVEEVTFKRLDSRLSEYLLEAASLEVRHTHQEIAVELGSSREGVSRLLKDFERRGLVSLARGRIRLLDPKALRDMVTDPPAESELTWKRQQSNGRSK